MLNQETYKGFFFLPDIPNKEVAGQIHVDYKTNIRLELFGSFYNKFEEITQDKTHTAIWGYLFSGQKISLINCRSVQWSYNFGGYANDIYNSEVILKGIHIKNLEEKKFYEMYAEFDYLYDWIGIANLSPTYSEDKKTINLKYTVPEDVEFEINEVLKGSITFTHNLPITNGLNLVPLCYFKLVHITDCSFKDLRNALWKFQTLLSFFTLNKVRIKSLSVYSKDVIQKINDNLSIPNDIDIFYNQISTEFDEVNVYDFLLTYNQLSRHFQEITNIWFKNHEDINPIIHILYRYFGESKQFTESNFLNIVQAVEAYHRRYIQDTTSLKKINTERLSNIYKNISSDTNLKWLKDKLCFSYEPSLKTRLTELFDLTKSSIFLNPDDSKMLKIIRKIVDTRNYYNHYQKDLEKKKANSQQMLSYSKLLRNILIVIILKSLNVSEDLMQKAIKDNMKFRLS